MTSPTLLSLAERVQNLTGPCRETDARIQCALDGHQFVSFSDKRGMDQISTISTGDKPLGIVLAYTASLDAAMTLVPEGCTFAVGDCGINDIPSACITDSAEVDHFAEAATPALALTAASLRARAASENSHG